MYPQPEMTRVAAKKCDVRPNVSIAPRGGRGDEVGVFLAAKVRLRINLGGRNPLLALRWCGPKLSRASLHPNVGNKVVNEPCSP